MERLESRRCGRPKIERRGAPWAFSLSLQYRTLEFRPTASRCSHYLRQPGIVPPLMLPKILLVRKLPTETFALSAVVNSQAMEWHRLRGLPEIAAALESERFALLILDHRVAGDDPLAFLTTLRRAKRPMPIILISERLPMESVIRAIGAGFRDMFSPPLNPAMIVERVHAVLNLELASARGARVEDWGDLLSELGADQPAGGLAKTKKHLDKSEADVGPAGTAAEGQQLDNERRLLAESRRQLDDERDAAKRIAAELTAREQAAAAERHMIDAMAAKLDSELAAHSEAKIWLEQERETFDGECETQVDAAGGALVADGSAREEAFHAKERALEETAERLAALEEKLDSDFQIVKQGQAKFVQEREALAKALLVQQAATNQLAKAESEAVARAQALAAKDKAHAEAVAGLAAERESFSVAQRALQQAQAKLEQDHAAVEKVLARQKELAAQAEAQANHERVQAAATARLAALEKKNDSDQQLVKQAQAKLAQERDALAKVQAAQKDAMARAAKVESEMSARVQALAAKDKTQAEAAAKLAAEQEKVLAAQRSLQQAQLKLEQDRVAVEKALTEKKEVEARAQAIGAKERMQAATAGRLTALEEKLDSEQLILKQAQAKLEQENDALAKALAAHEKSHAAAVSKYTADQKKAESAQRDELAQLQKQRAALESERGALKEAAAKITAEQKDFEAQKARLEQQQRELANREAPLREAEAQVVAQAAQCKKAEARLANERASVAAERAGMEEEAEALAERVRAFEQKQQHLKERMNQLLAAT
ncbi:MAG: response regulator [Opitutaceae bacterium]